MTAPRPLFSIVVPTRNRSRELAGCLRAIAALNYPRDGFEVIVVNDGGSRPALDADLAASGLTIAVFDQPHRGPSAARACPDGPRGRSRSSERCPTAVLGSRGLG